MQYIIGQTKGNCGQAWMAWLA